MVVSDILGADLERTQADQGLRSLQIDVIKALVGQAQSFTTDGDLETKFEECVNCYMQRVIELIQERNSTIV